jgi:pimeloyl-ACP methyl ester carboxylesterase
MKTILRLLCSFVLASFVTMPDATAAPSAVTAETRYVEVNGTKIAYRKIGNGTPLLLANRMRGTLDTWAPLFLDELARAHTVITFDYPGIGYSSGKLPDDMGHVADFINDLAGALKLEKFAILGWSWGGFASQTLVVDHPGRVTHAILVGTNPPGKDQLPIEQLFWNTLSSW